MVVYILSRHKVKQIEFDFFTRRVDIGRQIYFLFIMFYLLIVCWYMCACTHILWHECRNQRTTCGNQFSLVMCVLGMNSDLQVFQKGPLSVEPSFWTSHSLKKKNNNNSLCLFNLMWLNKKIWILYTDSKEKKLFTLFLIYGMFICCRRTKLVEKSSHWKGIE